MYCDSGTNNYFHRLKAFQFSTNVSTTLEGFPFNNILPVKCETSNAVKSLIVSSTKIKVIIVVTLYQISCNVHRGLSISLIYENILARQNFFKFDTNAVNIRHKSIDQHAIIL